MEKAYKERVVYQIYPASFKDDNNDGWGDLKGITNKLDYLKSLGVGIIWLSPIYSSPMNDMGYDISDYKAINPLFGTMEDFDILMHEATIRDIKVVMDLVINHTSSEHKWFKEAINNPTTKYRGYYYFSKGKGKKYNRYPNNWQSVFAGSAWEPLENDSTTYYLHLYSKEQPDLNYHNEDVIKEIESILKFWLDKGVYGFRCDVINSLWKTSLKNGKRRITQTGKEFYEDQPLNHELLKRFRKDVIDKYDAFLVGEDASATIDVANKYIDNKELEMLITFEHQYIDKFKSIPLFKKHFCPAKLLKILFSYQESCHYNALYFENHDQLRSVSRFVNKKYHDEGAKAYAMLLLTLKGTPFIYNGEEIGMTNLSEKIKHVEDAKDVVVYNIYDLLRKFKFPKKLALNLTHTSNRDNERTPMQWNDRINAGFNKGWKPWLNVNSNYLDKNINVSYEENDPDSILNFYKKLIEMRNNNDILKKGTIKRLSSNPNVAKYVREYKGKKLLIIINLSSRKIYDKNVFDRKLIITNYRQDSLDFLPPYFCAIYTIA